MIRIPLGVCTCVHMGVKEHDVSFKNENATVNVLCVAFFNALIMREEYSNKMLAKYL